MDARPCPCSASRPRSLLSLFAVVLVAAGCASEGSDGAADDAADGAAPAEDALQSQDTLPDATCEGDACEGPVIRVEPEAIDFGDVPVGEGATEEIEVSNDGDQTLVVGGFFLSGDPGFAVLDGEDVWPASGRTSTVGVPFSEPLVLAPGEGATVQVRFLPSHASPATGALALTSSDPEAAPPISLFANHDSPCIAIEPRPVDFGCVAPGDEAHREVEITSCGSSDLWVGALHLTEASSEALSLELAGLPGVPDGTDAIVEGDGSVFALPVGESATFTVRYAPEAAAPPHEFGNPAPPLGSIRVASNALQGEAELRVRGVGVDGPPGPTPVIMVAEGTEVFPMTKLHLVGSQSYAADGAIAAYKWSVLQPPGSQSVFVPSTTAPDPTFEVNTVGTYTFRLDVWDEEGERPCSPAQYRVFVAPDAEIHVELVWHTPADPDQTDEGPGAGADLDLHFKHSDAVGEDTDGDGEPDGWFDIPYDCFWFNSHPDWGTDDPNVDDDPRLTRDDTDGAGPEIVSLNRPEDDATYTVGVHYWNDHGFGTSYATVRIRIDHELVFESDEVKLLHHDMWEVATIDRAAGFVMPLRDEDGEYRILPEFRPASFFSVFSERDREEDERR